MKRIGGAVAGIVTMLLLCSGAFSDIARFFAWLFTLRYSQPETSVVGGIAVRILTFLASYSLVGVIFSAFGWFNSKAMSIVYFVVSTLLGFALAYLVWTIEQYILIIGIIFGIIVLFAIAFLIVWFAFPRKKLEKKTKDQEVEE